MDGGWVGLRRIVPSWVGLGWVVLSWVEESWKARKLHAAWKRTATAELSFDNSDSCHRALLKRDGPRPLKRVQSIGTDELQVGVPGDPSVGAHATSTVTLSRCVVRQLCTSTTAPSAPTAALWARNSGSDSLSADPIRYPSVTSFGYWA